MRILDMIMGGRFGTKQSRATAALVGTDNGVPRYTHDRYAALAEQGVMRNVWVKRCIQLIATSGSGVKWGVYKKNSDGKPEEIDVTRAAMRTNGLGMLLDIIHGQANDRGQSFAGVIEATLSFWHVSGNYFIEQVGLTDDADGPAKWLYPWIPDDHLKVIPDATDFVRGYVYDSTNGRPMYFEPGMMLHGKFWHPTDLYYGLSPVRAAMTAIDSFNSSRDWNVSMLQNNARPAGILSAPDLDEPELDNLERRLDKKWGGRGGNASQRRIRRPLVLSGGLKWESMSLTPAEMDWLEGMRTAKVEIAAIHGVPPEMLGDAQSKTYDSYSEARRSFYEDTLLPLLDRLRDDLNAWLSPRYGEGYYLDYKRDEIEALQENRDAVWGRTLKGFDSNVVARDEARAALKLPAVDNGQLVFATDLVRAGQSSTSLDPVIGKSTILHLPASVGGPRVIGNKARDLSTDEAKAAYLTETVDMRVKAEQTVEALALAAFDDERAAVVHAIENASGIDSVMGVAAKAVSVEPWAAVYALAWKGTLDRFGLRELEGLKGRHRETMEFKAASDTDIIDIFQQASEAFAEAVVPLRITGVTDTTRAMVTKVITTGISNGDAIPVIAKAIDEAYGGIGYRATMIARTEVIGASGAGGQIMADATGLKLAKEWLAALDTRVRSFKHGDKFDHAAMHGVSVPLDKMFSVPVSGGNENLLFPGDPRASAGNVIGCRCAAAHNPID